MHSSLVYIIENYYNIKTFLIISKLKNPLKLFELLENKKSYLVLPLYIFSIFRNIDKYYLSKYNNIIS